jgi:hypothetical protein
MNVIKCYFTCVVLGTALSGAEAAAVLNLTARPAILRIDLEWPSAGPDFHYQVQRSSSGSGDWKLVENPTPEFRRFSDYIGESGKLFYYRVRAFRPGRHGSKPQYQSWSHEVSGRTLPFDRQQLMEDVQKSAVQFYVDQAHPVSGLSPEGKPGWGDICAIGATGMGMANLVVGVERGYIGRDTGLDLALRILRFMDRTAQKHHGAMAHWMDGKTGEIRRFGKQINSVDLVETSFFLQGAILLREYFKGSSPGEMELREIVDRLVAGVEWPRFMVDTKEGPVMAWNWSPEDGPSKLHIRGFHEAMMPYILGIASETHAIDSQSFYTGWMHPRYGLGREREHFGIQHFLARGVSWPLFFAHYSHIGIDPREISYRGRTYMEHFIDACRIHVRYARSRANEFKGYDTLWGLAASLYPGGYRANHPGPNDDGTIATTAALSSMPYLPDDVLSCMESMYLDYGHELWGAYGFYNAINPTKEWVGRKYIGIELGPIAPMIENYRSGLLWKLFMETPEIRRALVRIEKARPEGQPSKK